MLLREINMCTARHAETLLAFGSGEVHTAPISVFVSPPATLVGLRRCFSTYALITCDAARAARYPCSPSSSNTATTTPDSPRFYTYEPPIVFELGFPYCTIFAFSVLLMVCALPVLPAKSISFKWRWCRTDRIHHIGHRVRDRLPILRIDRNLHFVGQIRGWRERG